jgi:hypothetical protein
VSEEVALKIMKRFDTSGDGAIQLDEFKGNLNFELFNLFNFWLHLLTRQYYSVTLLPV